MDFLASIAGLSLIVWLYLAMGRDFYWLDRNLLERELVPVSSWPPVTVLIPARNEVDVIGRSLASILAQDYPGRLDVILIDDHSADATAHEARKAAAQLGAEARLKIIPARDLPRGWSGKLWALSEGLTEADKAEVKPEYIWFSDADIAHEPDTLLRLVAKSLTERRDLVSLMAELWCRSAWERLLIPPFVYFFQMLYPFPAVNDPARRAAAAAGGCVLVRRKALKAAGDLQAIGSALIDDCSLARIVKDLTLHGDPASLGGGIWLGRATGSRSLRPYAGLSDIWRMVARTAYTQLRYSRLLLAGTLLGMVLTYLVPPFGVLLYPWHGSALAAAFAGSAWLLMALTAWPTYRAYGQAAWRSLTLPAAAAFYSAMTFDSAWRHWRGRGGAWKGRIHAGAEAGTLAPPPREL
jgi:hopene-associated glycosyltransferase HpnB